MPSRLRRPACRAPIPDTWQTWIVEFERKERKPRLPDTVQELVPIEKAAIIATFNGPKVFVLRHHVHTQNTLWIGYIKLQFTDSSSNLHIEQILNTSLLEQTELDS